MAIIYRRNVLILAIIDFTIGFTSGYLVWFLPLHVTRIGGAVLMATFFSVSLFISSLISVISGVASDTLGRKPVIVLSRLLLLISMVLMTLYLELLIPLFVAIVIFYITGSLLSNASITILVESVEERVRGRILALFGIVGLAGYSSGSIVLGYLVERFSVNTALIVTLVLALVSLISSFFLIETGVKPQTTSKASTTLWSSIVSFFAPLREVKSMLTSRSIYPLIILRILGGFATGMGNTFFSPYLSKVAKFREAEIGLLYSTVAVSQAAGQPPSGWFVDKRGCVEAMLLFGLTTIATGVVFVTATTFFERPLVILIVFLTSLTDAFLVAFYSTGWNVYIARITTPTTRATFYGVFDSLGILSIPAPLLGSILWSIKPQMVYIACIVITIFEIPFILMLRSGRSIHGVKK